MIRLTLGLLIFIRNDIHFIKKVIGLPRSLAVARNDAATSACE
jgi:hypothetical protein